MYKTAFPYNRLHIDRNGRCETIPEPGMALRDWFATHAPEMPEQWWKDTPKTKENGEYIHYAEAQAAWAFFYADAMMKERIKK